MGQGCFKKCNICCFEMYFEMSVILPPEKKKKKNDVWRFALVLTIAVQLKSHLQVFFLF